MEAGAGGRPAAGGPAAAPPPGGPAAPAAAGGAPGPSRAGGEAAPPGAGEEPGALPPAAGPGAAERDAELAALEGRLGAPDAILEPGVMELIRQYVGRGGQPQRVVEQLSDHYQGLATMAELVHGWYPASGAPKSVGGGRAGKGAGGGGAPAEERDLRLYLEDLVEEQFDPAVFSDMFSSGKGAPAWLGSLIEVEEGRRLIYRLAQKHKDSLLLNFAVQCILQQGHEKEVLTMGGSVAGNFGVFHRVLCGVLKQLPEADDEDFPAHVRELCQLTCESEHTYVYAQLMLAHLVGATDSALLGKVAGELEAYAASKFGAVMWKLKALHTPTGTDSLTDSDAANSISNIMGQETVVAGDTIKLDRLFGDTAKMPSLALLQSGQLLKKLLKDLFTPNRVLSEGHKQANIRLLALGTAARDLRPRGGDVDLSRVPEVGDAIREGLALIGCSQEVEAARFGLFRYPAVSLGILFWVKKRLLDPEFYETQGVTLKPWCLKFLAKASLHQPSQGAVVLGIIVEALGVLGNSDLQFSQQLLDVVLFLLEKGSVVEVLDFMAQWSARSPDPYLVRQLVFGAIAMAGAPYSYVFGSALLKTMAQAGIKKDRDLGPNSKYQNSLRNFLIECDQSAWRNLLGEEEIALVEGLLRG